MQSVHCQVLNSLGIFVHGEKFASIDSENGLTDFSKAAQHGGTTAVRDTDGEVIGWNTVRKCSLARLAEVFIRVVLNDLLLANLTGIVEHLTISTLWNKDPR